MAAAMTQCLLQLGPLQLVQFYSIFQVFQICHALCTPSCVLFPTCYNRSALSLANLKAMLVFSHIGLCLTIFVLQCSNTVNILFCKVKQPHYIDEADNVCITFETLSAKIYTNASEFVEVMQKILLVFYSDTVYICFCDK